MARWTEIKTAYNTRLAQWGLISFIVSFCYYCKFVLADNLVFQNPPLRQAWERYIRFCRGEIQHSNQLERFEKITF
jgi:hypothetical protein